MKLGCSVKTSGARNTLATAVTANLNYILFSKTCWIFFEARIERGMHR